MISQAALVAVFLLLTHRLSPVVFGVFAFATAVVDLLVMQGATAAADAVVRTRDFSQRNLSTVFWSLVGVCGVATAVLCASSGSLARAMGAPDAAPVLFALSLTLLVVPLTVGPTAIMRDAMDFRGMATWSIAGTLAGGAVAVGVAYSPGAEWALVAQRWTSLSVTAGLMLMHTRAVPRAMFNRGDAKAFFAASGRLFLAQGVIGAFPRFLDVIIGVQFGAAVLGCFRVVTRICEMVIVALVNPIGQLWLVLMSKARSSDHDFRRVFLKLAPLTALIAVPAFAGVAFIAQDLTDLILPQEYAAAGPMLAIMASLGIFAPLNNPRNAVLTALGRFNLLLLLAAVELGTGIIAVLVAANYGVAAALASTAIPILVNLALSLPLILKSCSVRVGELAAAMWRPYVGVILMSLVLLLLQPMLQLPPAARIAITTIVGGAVYAAWLLLLTRRWTFATISMSDVR